MKRFIIKGALFVIPVMLLYVFRVLFYSTDKGDLIRLGYIMDNSGYDSKIVFSKEYEQKEHFINVSALNQDSMNEFTVLIFGDSFSDQGSFGYKNYLAEQDSISVLHYDNHPYSSPIENLYGAINGNTLDKIKVKYVILQSVERFFVDRGNADTTKKIMKEPIVNAVKMEIPTKAKESSPDDFFSKINFTFPLRNIYYLFDDNAFDSETYSVETSTQLFSTNKKNVLFYYEDLGQTPTNNDNINLLKLNATLNDLSYKLSKKGIRLIVLPSPDKYDFYYEYLIDKEKYIKSMFFEKFDQFQKKYIYINSKSILKKELKNQKDVYFYDDTHWSPKASKVIAKEIAKVIKKL